MVLKSGVYQHFMLLLQQKIQQLQQVLAELKETGANETKSTAGDKHETALAMIQIEQANKRAQLNELFAQKAAMDKIDPMLFSDHIIVGSLVKTNRGNFFLSAALGKATINGLVITAISPQSPLGRKLVALKAGDTAEVNGNNFEIESIG